MRLTPLRLASLLVIGLFLLWTQLRSREDRYGGPARYEGRESNTQAWQSHAHLTKPTAQEMLAVVCRYACKDSSWKEILRPDDNFHHMLASLNDLTSKEPPGRMPEKIAIELMWQEEGIDLRGKVHRETTLEDILRLMNGLPSLHP